MLRILCSMFRMLHRHELVVPLVNNMFLSGIWSVYASWYILCRIWLYVVYGSMRDTTYQTTYSIFHVTLSHTSWWMLYVLHFLFDVVLKHDILPSHAALHVLCIIYHMFFGVHKWLGYYMLYIVCHIPCIMYSLLEVGLSMLEVVKYAQYLLYVVHV